MRCEHCGAVHEDTSDFSVGVLIGDSYDWSSWASWPDGHQNLVRHVDGVGLVERLFKFVTEDERHFGGDIEAVMIFTVNGKLFKKTGTTNSYGETVWDKAFTAVVAKEVTRVEFGR